MKFLKCEICGNIVGFVEDKGAPLMCCGKKMTELEPGTSDGAHEKHVPVITVDGNCITVEVGEVHHPMIPEHYIGWIALETKNGNQRKVLTDTPVAKFAIASDDEVVSAYAYCNLHGLWKGTK